MLEGLCLAVWIQSLIRESVCDLPLTLALRSINKFIIGFLIFPSLNPFSFFLFRQAVIKDEGEEEGERDIREKGKEKKKAK